MSKTVLSILIGALLVSGALYITSPKEETEINDEEEVIEEEEVENEEKEEEEDKKVKGSEGVEINDDKEVTKEEEDKKVEGNKEIANIVDCLEEEGVVVYGSRTCPACAQLAEGFGGYDVIASIYVECMEERDRCDEEKLTGFVPEIQIKGEIHEGRRDPASLAEAVECEV